RGLSFDPAYGRTGGEDDDFFRRMAAAGATLVVTDRAKAWEDVPLERATAGSTPATSCAAPACRGASASPSTPPPSSSSLRSPRPCCVLSIARAPSGCA